MNGKSRRKKYILSATALTLVAALGAGIWFGTRGGGEPVNVYPFEYIGMTEFWGDSQESYGPVTTDKIQTVFLSDTQTVTEVLVKDGDTVKKGDVLISFDTTLDALSLERKRLDVEKIKVQIQAAAERLEETYDMVPYIAPGIEDSEEEIDLGEELKEKPYKISEQAVYDGKTAETALICWLKDGTPVTDAMLQELYETALKFQTENANKPKPEEEEKEESSASALPESQPVQSASESAARNPEQKQTIPMKLGLKDQETNTQNDSVEIGKDSYKIVDAYTYRGKTYWLQSAVRITGDGSREPLTNLIIPAYPQSGEAEQQEWKSTWENGIEVTYMREVSFSGRRMEEGQMVSFEQDAHIQLEVGQDALIMVSSAIKDLSKEHDLTFEVIPANGIFRSSSEGNYLILTGKPEEVTAAPVSYTVKAIYTFDDNYDQQRAVEESFSFKVSVVPEQAVKKGEFYVVFKVTQDNFQKGVPTVWQGAKVTVYEDGSFGMSLYDASAFADHTLPPPEEIEIELPEIDPNAIYTPEQILDMQKQLNATLKEQKEKLKMAEAEYKIMERELNDGNIYADIDGQVVSLLTEEEAKQNNEPMIKVSGGGGFYVEGSVSELEKDKLKPGQEVTVNDWNTGGVYTGEVVSIGDFPSDSDNWNGMGNPNASYYPFRAFIDGEANLQAGSYVSMSYSTSSGEQGIYLEKPFIRTEQGKSYVFVMGSDGKLEKRFVRVGKTLWGSYFEILSGLSENDLIAFPYGKNVKDGAPAVESDISALYTY